MQQKKQQNIVFKNFLQFFTKFPDFCKQLVERQRDWSALVEFSTSADSFLQLATLEFCKKLSFATKKLRKFLSF